MSCRSSDSARSGDTPSLDAALRAAQDHLALAPEIAGRASGGALDGRHLLAQRLAARDQFHQPAVQIGQLGSQFIQIHVGEVPNFLPHPLVLTARGYRKQRGTANILV
jgi:hypothetical protein